MAKPTTPQQLLTSTFFRVRLPKLRISEHAELDLRLMTGTETLRVEIEELYRDGVDAIIRAQAAAVVTISPDRITVQHRGSVVLELPLIPSTVEVRNISP